VVSRVLTTTIISNRITFYLHQKPLVYQLDRYTSEVTSPVTTTTNHHHQQQPVSQQPWEQAGGGGKPQMDVKTASLPFRDHLEQLQSAESRHAANPIHLRW